MQLILGTIQLVRNFLNKMKEDDVSAFSAQAALFIIISFFPFIMFLLTLLQYLPITEDTLISLFSNVGPSVVNSLLVLITSEIYAKASGTVISVTVITALWSASKGFLAIVKGLNSVYGIKESRNYIKLRIISTIYTLIFAIILIITLGFLVFGNKLYLWVTDKLPFLNDFALLVISFRTIVGLLLLAAFFLLLYKVIPNRKTKIIAELPGALIAASGWMGFSYLYSFYIDHIGNFSYMYGSLTAIVLLMLWLYFCMYILFIGAEINDFLSNNSIVKFLKK